MARGRFITGTLGASHKLASVTDDAHRLMFILMVTNADVEGRLDADPRVLNGRVFTLMGWSPEHVEAGLEALARAELIHWYSVENRAYAEIVNFHEHNSVRRDREQASRIPGPDQGSPMPSRRTAGERRESSGSTPAEVKVSQDKIKSSTREELSSTSSTRAHYQTFLEAWNDHRGNLPACTTLNDKRKRGIDNVIKDHQHEALDIFTAAVMHVATDDYWVQQGYNIDNLLRPGRVLEKAEKWRAAPGMTSNNRKTANIAATIARAIGGLDA